MKNQNAVQLGKQGGLATKKKYGAKYFSRLGKLGAAKRWHFSKVVKNALDK